LLFAGAFLCPHGGGAAISAEEYSRVEDFNKNSNKLLNIKSGTYGCHFYADI
jgi:hypothetical protein